MLERIDIFHVCNLYSWLQYDSHMTPRPRLFESHMPFDLDAWREDAVATFAGSLRAHRKLVIAGAAAQPPRTSARQDLSAYSWHELRSMARRAGAEEAARRRTRAAALADAIWAPLARVQLRAWRNANSNNYTALQQRRTKCVKTALRLWRDFYDAALTAVIARFLHKWWLSSRSVVRCNRIEEEAARASRCRQLRRFFSRVGTLIHVSKLEQREVRARRLEHTVAMLRLWRRVALARASIVRQGMGRRALRAFRSCASVGQQRRREACAPHGAQLYLALRGWRRMLEVQRCLTASLTAWRIRAIVSHRRRKLDQTLHHLGTYTAARSATQGVLARLLLHAWRRQERAKQRMHAVLFATERALRLAIRGWRVEALASKLELQVHVPTSLTRLPPMGRGGAQGAGNAEMGTRALARWRGVPAKAVEEHEGHEKEQRGQRSTPPSRKLSTPRSLGNFKLRREILQASSPIVPLQSQALSPAVSMSTGAALVRPSSHLAVDPTSLSYLQLEPLHRATLT